MPFGEGNIAFGLDRMPFGEGNIAFGLDRMPFGEGNIAFGLDRMPFGEGNIAFGLDRMQFGEDKPAFGPDQIEGFRVQWVGCNDSNNRGPTGLANVIEKSQGLTSFAVEKRLNPADVRT
jgi:hypothetical protein